MTKRLRLARRLALRWYKENVKTGGRTSRLFLLLASSYGVLYVRVTALVSEYELSITIGFMTYIVSIALTFGVSLLVGLMVARKNRKIDMVEALKGAE